MRFSVFPAVLRGKSSARVRRGALLVIPSGRALLYADLSTCRPSAVQCRSCAWLCSRSKIGLRTDRRSPSAASAQPAADLDSLIAEAAKDLADYQRLTAEGKLGEARQKLEELKRALDKVSTRQR
jgi:hypothetical protein